MIFNEAEVTVERVVAAYAERDVKPVQKAWYQDGQCCGLSVLMAPGVPEVLEDEDNAIAWLADVGYGEEEEIREFCAGFDGHPGDTDEWALGRECWRAVSGK
jgi:hypothetical protein